MSIYYAIDEGEPVFLASNSGWSALIDWTNGIKGEKIADLAHLLDHGWTEDAAEAVDDLRRLVKHSQPDEDVRPIVEALLTALQGAGDEGVLTITDGLSPVREQR